MSKFGGPIYHLVERGEIQAKLLAFALPWLPVSLDYIPQIPEHSGNVNIGAYPRMEDNSLFPIIGVMWKERRHMGIELAFDCQLRLHTGQDSYSLYKSMRPS